MEIKVIGILAGAIGLSTLLAQLLGKAIDAIGKRNGKGSERQQLDALKALTEGMQSVSESQRDIAQMLRQQGTAIRQTNENVLLMRTVLTERERSDMRSKIDHLDSVVSDMKKGQTA